MEEERAIKRMNQRFGELNGNVAKIAECLCMSEIRKGVHEFDGSQKIDTWVDLIEKMRQIYGLDDSATITLAFLKINGRRGSYETYEPEIWRIERKRCNNHGMSFHVRNQKRCSRI